MLRTAAIASLGPRRLVAASTTAAAPGSQSPLLLKFTSAPAASPVRRLLPTLDLTRGYARGRQSSFSDDEDDYEPEATGMSDYYDSDRDEIEIDDGSDENRWDDAEEVADDSE